MNMAFSLQEIEALNAKASSLNLERQRLLGQQESAQRTYERSVEAYKQKYGVDLSDVNLQAEYNSVAEKVQKDAEHTAELIVAIQRGDYKKVEPVAGEAPVAPTAAPVAQTIPDAPVPGFGQAPVAAPVQESPVIQAPVAPVAQPQTQPQTATPPVQPPMSFGFGAPPETVVPEEEKPFAPVGWGTTAPAQGDAINQQFGAILGQGFKPGN